MSYNPTEWGDTTPNIKSGYASKYAKLLTMFPFNKIERRIIEGQEMTFFPKTYCKVNRVAGQGRQIIFADSKRDSSYKLMTCFHDFRTGAEVSEGVCHARYVSSKGSDEKPESKAGASFWASINLDDSRTKAKSRGTGWDILNVWDYFYRGFLMLMETIAMGYPQAETSTALMRSSYNFTHFGIQNPVGANNNGAWIFGFRTIPNSRGYNNVYKVIDKNGTYHTIYSDMFRSGWAITFSTEVTDEVCDLNEMLLGLTNGNSSVLYEDASIPNYYYMPSGGTTHYCMTTISYMPSNELSSRPIGPFAFNTSDGDSTDQRIGFWLRKAV